MRSFIFITVTMIFLSFAASAQTADKLFITEKIQVAGNCGMCKERIENAAYGKGVKHAEWDKNTGILTVTYRQDKTNLESISRRIADVGHDADQQPADHSSYEKLPACCSYKSNAHRH